MLFVYYNNFKSKFKHFFPKFRDEFGVDFKLTNKIRRDLLLQKIPIRK